MKELKISVPARILPGSFTTRCRLPAATPCLSVTATAAVCLHWREAAAVLVASLGVFPTGEILCTLDSFLLVDGPVAAAVAEQMSVLTATGGAPTIDLSLHAHC